MVLPVWVPRQTRVDALGMPRHVIIRGMGRRWIFKDDLERDNLLQRLAMLLSETRPFCFARARISNHALFLFKTGDNSPVHPDEKASHRLRGPL